MGRRVSTAFVVTALSLACAAAAGAQSSPGVTLGGALPGPLPLFPADNWWNADVSLAPVDPRSDQFISWMNANGLRRLHPDWGADSGDSLPNAIIYGMPYVVVPGTQPLVPVTFYYDSESDSGAPNRPPGYPIPDEAKTDPRWIEGGVPGGGDSGDRHMLIVDRDRRLLYELYALQWNAGAGRWDAGSGAVFPLDSNARRPDGWTSADAAGLAILPGLVRYDEVYGADPIRHAFRMTVRATNGYVFPASHRAGSNPSAPPMGTRFRLKAAVDLSGFTVPVRKVLQAMKTYGLIVADNGSDMYITGTNDPRWSMDAFVQEFWQLSAADFEVITLGWQASPAPSDVDGDGLADGWEVALGLDPANGGGDEGAAGDPDADGLSNVQEQAAGTHPRGFVTRYFAEGANDARFGTAWALLNPTAGDAHVLLRHMRSDGQTITDTVLIPPHTRLTRSAHQIAGLEQSTFSTVIESDGTVVADRTMSWDARGFGSHAERAIEAPAPRWYLAEGATHSGFQLFYLLQNPSDAAIDVRIVYLRPAPAPPIVDQRALVPRSRTTIWVNLEPGLAATDVSAVVETVGGEGIIVERAMYRDARGLPFDAGHASAGVTAPSTEWFVAEGATGTWFDSFLLLANPNDVQAEVSVRYQLPDGTSLTRTYHVSAWSRRSIWVDHEGPPLANTAFAAVVSATNGVPIIVERAMWWPGPTPASWYEAHSAPAVSTTGVEWGFAEGEADNGGQDTFLLIANTASQAGAAVVTLLFEDGTSVARTYELPAASRTSVWVNVDFPSALGRRFGALVTSAAPASVPLVVERAIYSSLDGTRWSAGTSAVGTKLR